MTESATHLVALSSTGRVADPERVLLHAMSAAVGAGWRVTCVSPSGPLAERLVGTAIRHVRIPDLHLAAGPATAPRLLARWIRAAHAVRRSSRGADVVLANSVLALPAVRLARLRHAVRADDVRPPVVWLAHTVVSAGLLRLYRWCAPALTTVIGTSQAALAPLRSAAGDSRPRLEVVHNGVAYPVDLADEQVTGLAADPPRVGLVVTPASDEDEHAVLDAIALVAVPVEVELLQDDDTADTASVDRLRRRVAALGLDDRVSVLEPQTDHLARMRTWSVVVTTGDQHQACPLGVLEAMSLGLPVIAVDQGGAREVLGDAGLLVPVRDAAALADAITRMVRDISLREACAARGLGRIALAHRLGDQTDRLLGALVTTMREGRSA